MLEDVVVVGYYYVVCLKNIFLFFAPDYEFLLLSLILLTFLVLCLEGADSTLFEKEGPILGFSKTVDCFAEKLVAEPEPLISSARLLFLAVY